MITVTGIFHSRADAERAVELLRSIDLNDEHLALLAPGAPDEEVEEAVTHTETEEKGAGKKVGGALGRGLGIAGGIMVGGAVGSFFVPGVGAVLAAGVLAAAILGMAGAGLGKAAGGEIDEAVVSSLRHDEIHIYEEALRQGRAVLIAMVSSDERAEDARRLLLNAGAISLDEAHESWWSRLRRAEEEEYARRGHDFAKDESLYRRGFEAAQHPVWRGKPFADADERLRERYGDESRQNAFRHGYERGLSHHRQVMEKYQSKPDQVSDARATVAKVDESEIATPAIEFRNVDFSYEDKKVLDDLSFTVRKGEIKIILSGSGGGKSTILKLILGLLKPDAGQIFVDGEEITNYDETQMQRVRDKIGTVFQEGALFDSLSVYDNVAYRMHERDVPEEDVEREVRLLLRFVNLENEVDRLPGQLSGGMQKRVSVARALVGDPKIVLFDEPTAALDPPTAAAICELIIKLRDLEDVSSILVTHEMDVVKYVTTAYAVVSEKGEVAVKEEGDELCLSNTSILMLRDGRVIFSGTEEELVKAEDPYIQKFIHDTEVDTANAEKGAPQWKERGESL